MISEEVWEQAQIKVAAQAKKYEKVNAPKGEKIHLLSGLVKCPVCGAGMYGNKSIKCRKDGTRYNDYLYYGCKHRTMTRGHKCDYRKQISEVKLDGAVAEVIRKLVSNKKFAGLMREKINMEVDTSTLDQEIAAHEKTLRQCYSNKDVILTDLDNLDYEDKHYQRRKADLEDRLSKVYDKIEDAENLLVDAKARKRSILAEKVCGDNIYKALVFFDKMYENMNESERREFFTQLIEKIEIYEEEQANGQWLKSIEFKLPVISQDMKISLDNDSQTVSATAYCVQPSKAGPGDGVYKITKLGDSKALAKVCYYGTKASGENGFFSEKHPDFSAGKQFIIVHLAASYANNSGDAFSGTMQPDRLLQKNSMITA